MIALVSLVPFSHAKDNRKREDKRAILARDHMIRNQSVNRGPEARFTNASRRLFDFYESSWTWRLLPKDNSLRSHQVPIRRNFHEC